MMCYYICMYVYIHAHIYLIQYSQTIDTNYKQQKEKIKKEQNFYHRFQRKWSINGMVWRYFKHCTKSAFWITTYPGTVILLGVYLHLGHRLPQQSDREEWRLWASPPSCDQNKGKRSGWGVPSCERSESHRSSQSVASEKVVLVNKSSIPRELSWKNQYRNYCFKESFLWHWIKAATRTDHGNELISRRN